jgi:hypothetical protein
VSYESYCPTHGRVEDYSGRGGCPTCRETESAAELAREEILASLSEIAAKARARPQVSTNLGEYDCPYCMQTSAQGWSDALSTLPR